ncbi:energy-coupling factor transporter transmembrane protein EcfT [Adlercreutzia sp. ZJ138]|uniref:energy-coupling factor transporter transmembrane component T family protein n=1 Tax=Adlercreutzia sp. ZJ138 TaxID=2709405 RepID=UPI0013EE110A|nr:energy-coupling factor transporter transmembrane component T [Adlercreutzia sp. ZJ138]
MGNAFSFGSYYPASSALHRVDPRIKLALGFAFIVIILLAKCALALIAIAAFVAMLYAIARVPAVNAVKSLAPLMIIVVFASVLNLFMIDGGATLVQVGFIHITEEGVRRFLFVACRLALMMMGMSLITLTTTTLDLTEAFERLFSPLARIGVPAHELGMILGIALRFMPQFASELVWTYHAQVSRGATLGSSPVRGVRMLSSLMVPLFASVFRHAETLAQAMDARCYHGGAGRTKLHPLAFAPRDGVAVVMTALLLVCVLVANAFMAAA